MYDFLNFYDQIKNNYAFRLCIYHYKQTDYVIRIKYGEDEIVFVQHCDIELAFAKAHVEFKEWLSEHMGGY